MMTRTETISRLCQLVAEIEEIRTDTKSSWFVYGELQEVGAKVQDILQRIQQEEGGRMKVTEVTEEIRRGLNILASYDITVDDLSDISALFNRYGKEELLKLYEEWIENKRISEKELFQRFSDFVEKRLEKPVRNPFDIRRIAVDFQELHGDVISDPVRNALVRQWYRCNWDEIAFGKKEGGKQ